MNCPECKCERTDVTDIAKSIKTYIPNKGKHYLWKWGKDRLKARGSSEDTSFTARVRKCPVCETQFRSLEVASGSITPVGVAAAVG